MGDLTDTIEQYFVTSDYELVEVKSISRKGGIFVRITIDRAGGVSIGDCTRVHKDLRYMLRAEGWEDVAIEVTSPGPRRQLKVEQLPGFTGERIRVVLKEPVEKLFVFTGILESLDEESIKLLVDKREQRIPLNKVKRINLWR